jgi:hypothetical protein
VTLPGGVANVDYTRYGITGDDGSVPGQAGMDLPSVQELLKQDLRSSPGWKGSSAAVWGSAGLRPGTPLPLAIMELAINSLFGTDFQFDDVGALLTAVQAPFENINPFDPHALGTAIDQAVTNFGDALVTLLGDIVPFGYGDSVEAIASVIVKSFTSTVSLLLSVFGLSNQVADLASQVNFNPDNSAWDSYKNGDANPPFGSCVNVTTVDATHARWNFRRLKKPMEIRTISCFAQRSGAVDNFREDVYLINEDSTGTLIYTSADESDNIDLSAVTPLQHDIAVEDAIVGASGDIIGVRFRMEGTGSVTLLSNNNAPDGTTGNALPKQLGGVDDPTILNVPGTITDSQVENIWGPVTPYAELDVAQPPPEPRTIFDDFNDINLSATRWANRQSTAYWPPVFGQFYYLTAEDGKASYTSAADGFETAMTLQRLNMPANKCRLGVQVVDLSPIAGWAGFCVAPNYSSGVYLLISSTSVKIVTATAFNDFGIERASGDYTPSEGEWIYCQYDGDTDRYTVFSDTNPSICSWSDDTHVVPHGKIHRYGVVKLVQAAGIRSTRFDAFKLWDIDTSAPTNPGGGTGGGGPVVAPPTVGDTFPLTFAFTLAAPADELESTMLPATSDMIGTAAVDSLNSTMLPATSDMVGDVPTTAIAESTLLAATSDMTGLQYLFWDPFNTLTAAWSLVGVNASTQITVSGGEFLFAGPTSSGTENHAVSAQSFNITNRTVQVEVKSAALTSRYDGFGVSDAGFSVYARWLLYTDGYLYPQTNAGNLTAGLLYDPAVHKFLRIRDTGTATFFDWSTDGATWTNYGGAAPTYYNRAAAYVRFNYAATTATTSRFDNVIVSA